MLEVLLLLLLHLTLFRGATGDRGRICHAARSHNAWPGGLTSFLSRNGYVYSMAFFPLHSKCRKSAERRPNKFRPYRESSMLRCRTKPLATKTKNVVSLPGGLPPPGPPRGITTPSAKTLGIDERLRPKLRLRSNSDASHVRTDSHRASASSCGLTLRLRVAELSSCRSARQSTIVASFK